MLESIRVFVWNVTAAVDRVLCTGERVIADLFAVTGMSLWGLGALSAGTWASPAARLLVVAFGPWLAWTYLVERRLAERVRRARERADGAGVLGGRDVRVEMSLRGSEQVIALEAALLPVGFVVPSAALLIAAIMLVKVASIAVHAELPPRRSVWAALSGRVATLTGAPSVAGA